MKFKFTSKTLLSLFIISLVSITILIVPNKANAKVYSENSPRIETQNTESDALVITSPLNSDSILIGDIVTIDKEVNGNLFIIAKRVRINEKVNGSVYALSLDNIDVKAPISQSLGFITQHVYISAIGEIEKSVYGYTTTFIHEGRIGQNLNLSFSPEAEIRISGKVLGDFYFADTRPNITDKAYIEGKTIEKNFWKQFEMDKKESHEYTILSTIFFVLVIILFGLFLISTQRQWLEKTVSSMRTNMIKDLLAGFLAGFSILTVGLALLIMIFPFVYSILLWGFLYASMYLSPIFFSIFIGSFIITERNRYSIVYKLIAGVFIFSLLSLIPYVNVFLYIISSSLLLGELTRQYFSNSKPVVEATPKKQVNEKEEK